MGRHKREPVKHTCLDIDHLKKSVSGAFSALEDALNKLEGVEAELEKLREANSALREWGIEEADRVDELESELREMETERDKALALIP